MTQFHKIFSQAESRLPILSKIERPIFGAWLIIQDIERCDLVKQAYAMAYITLLSLIPSLAAIFSVISFFTPAMGKDGAIMEQIKDWLLSNLATGSGENAMNYINDMLSNLNLASIGWSSFAAMLFTLILQLKQIEVSLNNIWLVRKSRNLITRFLYFWTFLTLGALLVAIIVGSTSGFDFAAILEQAQPEDEVVRKTFFAWIAGFIFFYFLYKIVPNTTVRWKSAAIGAAVSALSLNLAAHLYGIFISNFANYKAVYGALAALPLFLMWLWICWLIILMGSLIAWRVQQGFPKQAEDATAGIALNSLERLRNMQIRSKIPLIILLEVYRNFDEAKGKGVTTESLIMSSKLPVGWITEALDILESLDYITAATSDNVDGVVIEDVESYFPARPAGSLSITSITHELSRHMCNWVDNWDHEMTLDMQLALSKIAGIDERHFEEDSIAGVLKELPLNPRSLAQS